jgi:hypothetical protein
VLFEVLGVLVWLSSLDPAVCDMQPGKTAGMYSMHGYKPESEHFGVSLCKKIRLYFVVYAEKVLDC